MAEINQDNPEASLLIEVSEYVNKMYEGVSSLAASDFISFNRLLSDLEDVFGELNRYDINTQLMVFHKYEHVPELGNVWLIRKKS